jgi:hypothetical protein
MKIGVVSLALIATGGLGSLTSSTLATSQEVAVPDVKPSGESSNEVLLSKEDNAVLNTSFMASGIFRGTEKISQGSNLYRVVSFASFLTIAEVWQPTMSHSFDTVDALTAQGVLIQTGYAGKGFEITVVPMSGTNWMNVRDINDLQFIVKQSGK